eukprot:748470-Hanusia_phi.AAC.2
MKGRGREGREWRGKEFTGLVEGCNANVDLFHVVFVWLEDLREHTLRSISMAFSCKDGMNPLEFKFNIEA